MQVQATTSNPPDTGADTVAVGVFAGEDVAHELPGGELGALLASGEASSQLRRVALTHADGRRFLVAGLGGREAFDAERARVLAALVEARARELGTKTLCWEVPHHVSEDIVAGLVEGTMLRAYRFDRYKPAASAGIERLLISAHHDVSAPVRRAEILAAAQNRARDLGNTPPNEMPPYVLAEYAQRLSDRHESVSVSVLDEEEIRRAGMGAFAAVSQGSAQPARLIQLDYSGSDDGPLVALVGKGVTFDSGGLALKSRTTMDEMKFDMCGGAAVLEAIGALAELSAPVRILGLIGAVENMPGDQAMRPSDIVRALDGTTIEINNPDAEGRLVLADCLTYARRQGAERLIDLATLTIIDAALGSTYAAVVANDDDLADRLITAGGRTGERLWRMPLHEEYADMIAGRYAQLTNRSERREAMPLTAAAFLHHFAGDIPWAHLDIAGTAYDVKRRYLTGKGATGFGVRLLVDALTVTP
jgi:leucyl aminopeptidase